MRGCDLLIDEVKRVAASGHFFREAHTLAPYEAAFYRAAAVGLVQFRALNRRRSTLCN
jgi:trimethylamine:corrinoid methyltransferase-like protein